MIFVDRFTIDDRFHWGQRIIVRRPRPGRCRIEMPVLSHVEVQQRIRVRENIGRSRYLIVTAARMKSHEMPALIAGAQTFPQRAPYFAFFQVIDGAVASDDPNDASISKPLTKKFSVNSGVPAVEDWWAVAMRLSHFIAPG